MCCFSLPFYCVATGGSQGPPPTATLSSHMSRGMEDCVQDIGHYLMEVERIPPRDPSLVALLSHLQFWTKGQELNNRGKPVTDDQVEPLHNTSLDSMASSSLEGTPSGPSVKPPAKRITYGRPSDLLQAAAALRSPTEPRFFSPTTHEYSSGLDLISSVAQQSSLVNTAEKGESQGSNIGKERGQHVELLVFNPQATQATSQHTVPAQNRAVVVMPLSAAAKPSATTMTSTAFVEGGHGQTIAFSHAPPAVVNPIKAEEQPCPPLNMPLQGWSASIIPLTAPSVMATTAPIALHPSAPQPTNRSGANVVSPSNLPVRREWQ